MSVVRRKYDVEFKKNAVKLSYASSKTVAESGTRTGDLRWNAVSLAIEVHA